MIRRTEYFNIIDKYLNKELSELELNEFEIEMELNSDLSEEVNLHLNIQLAIREQDIVSLREKMTKICNNQIIADNAIESNIHDSYNFALAEELAEEHNFNHKINMEDINNINHSFPKIHLYQHIMAAKENIYQFYKELDAQNLSKDQESYSPLDDALFEEIKEAIKETELLDIRANLKQIAASMPQHSYSMEDIDQYVYDQMNKEQKAKFVEELETNNNLANDVQLHNEIGLASTEYDIINLRSSLQNIIQKSTHQSFSRIEEIEGYINSELTEHEMDLFEAQLSDNKELNKEIELVKNINKALQENDIMQLRYKLRNIAENNIRENHSERSFTLKFRPRRISISIAAASLIMLMGITGLLSRYSAEDNIYQKFYAKYETTGIPRSSNTMNNQTLAIALQKFNNKDYESALNLLQEVISKDQNNTVGHFYSGVSFQEIGKYKDAIDEYEVVVTDKDNLFIEQAEWYIGLCYIQTKEDKKAIKQFNKIANNHGFYQQKATAILREMKSKR